MAAPWYEDAGNRSAMQSEIHLNADRAGENLMVSEDRRTVTQTGNTQHFDGAWILASGPGSAGLTRGRWVCTFTVKRRRRWMAVGFAMDSIKLNKPINRNNIFVYASTGSCKANEHVRDFDADRRAAKESEIPNFKGSYLGRFPLVSADFWTSDHLSERSRSVEVFLVTRARGTLTLKRR